MTKILMRESPGKSGATSFVFFNPAQVGEVSGKKWEENSPAVLGGRGRRRRIAAIPLPPGYALGTRDVCRFY